jgi:hypothetical protein
MVPNHHIPSFIYVCYLYRIAPFRILLSHTSIILRSKHRVLSNLSSKNRKFNIIFVSFSRTCNVNMGSRNNAWYQRRRFPFEQVPLLNESHNV